MVREVKGIEKMSMLGAGRGARERKSCFGPVYKKDRRPTVYRF